MHRSQSGRSPRSTAFTQRATKLPLLLVGAIWLWRRRPWGYLITGAGLVFWVLEGVAVATDQWLGHRADPASTVVSTAAVPVFAVVAAIALVAVIAFLRNVDRSGAASPSAS